MRNQIEIELNALQGAAVLALKKGRNKIAIEAGRGSGKSTILGYYIWKAVKEMPRATGVLVGATFVQIKSRTFPSTKEGLEMFGLYEGIDYIVGRSGASLGFALPFQAPNSWSNVIHFANGHILVMVSLDDPNSGRGLNSYYVIGDEAALLREERLFDNVLTTNRAKKIEFDKSEMLHAEIFTSTVALTQVGKWFTNLENLAKEKPEKYVFLKANARVNAMNLKEGWFEDMYDRAESVIKYNAEILNIRPPAVPDGFYASLNRSHYYSVKYDTTELGVFTDDFKMNSAYDSDIVKGVPLQLNLDFGGRINVATVSQFIKSTNTKQFINEFFAKNPEKLSDVVQKFIDYYEPHRTLCGKVLLFHDRSGYKSEANSKTTLAQDVENQLRRAGWTVLNKTPPATNNPSHILKFRLINRMLEEKEPNLPRIRINQDRCPNLIISMENAGLKHKEDSFEKDKSSERSATLPQEHATHLSDSLDYNIWWEHAHLIDLQNNSSFLISSF